MNQELQILYKQDQADRRDTLPTNLGERDAARRKRVEELIDAGALQAPEDYYHAAMVFQHGGTPEAAWQAYELAKRAAEMGHVRARWLTAAAYDRWLMRQGKPQKYGTQYIADGTCWKIWPIDPATTDAERAEWNVPTLEEAMQRAADLTRKRPPQHERRGAIQSARWGGEVRKVEGKVGNSADGSSTQPHLGCYELRPYVIGSQYGRLYENQSAALGRTGVDPCRIRVL